MNKKFLKKAAVGAALAMTFSTAAMAESFLAGIDPDGGVTTVKHFYDGAFADVWYFTISNATVLDTSVTNSNNNVPNNVITGGSYSLNSSTDLVFGNGDDVSLGSWAYDGTTGATQHSVLLGAGNYYFEVLGNVTGTNIDGSSKASGTYTLSTNLAPVPEPETYALMMAGLGLMGFVARRRKQQNSAA